MPPNYTLNVMPGHGIDHLAQQLRDQNVPEQQVHNVLANFEWHANQSAAVAKESGTETSITLKLPRGMQTGAPGIEREQGRTWLRRLIDRHGDDLPEPLKPIRERLFEPLQDQYSVMIGADTTRADMEKALAKQNVSLQSLEKQGFHIRADRRNRGTGEQTLTFKRHASSSGGIRQRMSGRAGKLARGKALLNKIIAQGGGQAPEKAFRHFGTAKEIPSVAVQFNGTPDYHTLTRALEQQGTTIDALSRNGYHVRASEKNGKITLIFKQGSSAAGGIKKALSGHADKLNRGAEVLRRIFDDATMVKSSQGIVQAQDLSQDAADGYFKNLTTENHPIEPAQDIEWPSPDPAVRAIIESPDDLSPLTGMDGVQAKQALVELNHLGFLLDGNSAAARLLARHDAYTHLYQETLGTDAPGQATLDFLEQALDDEGGFDERRLRDASALLLQRKLARGIQEAQGWGGMEPVSEEAVNCWRLRNGALQQAMELGMGPSDVQQLLVRAGGLTHTEFADLYGQEPEDDHNRQLTPLFKERDDLEMQVKELKDVSTRLDKTRLQLDDNTKKKGESARQLHENETRLNALMNPSEALIDELKISKQNPMAIAARIEEDIKRLKNDIQSIDKKHHELEILTNELEERAERFPAPLSELQEKLETYKELETQYIEAGRLLQQITEQVKRRYQ